METETTHRHPTLRASRTLLVIIAALALVGPTAGCDKSSESSDESTSGTKKEKSESQKQAASDETDEPESDESDQKSDWKRVSEKELSDAAKDKLERARTARKKLGSTLKKELKRAVSDRSFSGAVKFCNIRAPEIAKTVTEENNVEIGRTSHKLRNPDNTPPDWAAAAVERKEARQYIYRGPDEKLGYLHPIKLKGLCVNCHGAEDQLAPGVEDMLAKRYPKDEATGFEAGDLRGWFWVEVPDKKGG